MVSRKYQCSESNNNLFHHLIVVQTVRKPGGKNRMSAAPFPYVTTSVTFTSLPILNSKPHTSRYRRNHNGSLSRNRSIHLLHPRPPFSAAPCLNQTNTRREFRSVPLILLVNKSQGAHLVLGILKVLSSGSSTSSEAYFARLVHLCGMQTCVETQSGTRKELEL